jgi:MFS family permease
MNGRAGGTAMVWALGTTQIIGYGTLYYAFSILAASIAQDLNWSLEWVYGAFSAALLAGGLLAPISGGWIDRFGAGRVMALGSVAAALALAGIALAPDRAFFVLGLVAIEAVSTLVLYDSAFAALAQIAGADAKRRIGQLTLIGGFASTLFWPLTAWLLEFLTWREIYLLFAGLHLLLCMPLHMLLIARRLGPALESVERAVPAGREVQGSLPAAARRRAFLLLLAGFSAGGFVLSAVLVHMVPVLGGLGLGAGAVLVGSLFGPAQVLGRLVNMVLGRDLPSTRLAVLSAGLLPAAIALLLLTAPWLPAALLFAVVLGLGSGLVSIVRGTVPLELFGSRGYGAVLGKITAVRLVVTAGAPFAFALLLEGVGPASALWGMAAIGLLGMLALVALARLSAAAAQAVTTAGPAGAEPESAAR